MSRFSFKRFRRDLKDAFAAIPMTGRASVFSVVLVVCTFALPIWRILPLAETQSFIPLHYNVYIGIDRFGPWYGAFTIPVVSLVVLLVNLYGFSKWFRKEPAMTQFMAWALLATQVILLVSMIFLVLLNV